MLEQVDLTPALKKSEAKARLAELAPHLRQLQHDLWQAGVPLIAVFEGWDCAGKGECISLLAELLDPRGFRVHVTFEPTPEEAMRPFLWRFWTKTPAKGQIALFDRSWYQRILTDRVDGTVKRKVWRRAFHEIPEFEHTLTANGTALLKFWLHISKREQRRRFEKFEADPHERWRVRPADWRHHRRYGDFLAATEEMILRTDAATAPWTIIPAENLAFGKVLVVESLIEGMESALRHAKRAKAAAPSQSRPRPPRAVRRVKRSEPTILDRVDLSLRAGDDKAHRRELVQLQTRFRELEHRLLARRRPAIIVYEGWDAAGKGGNIKRLVARLDPRGYDVISIAKPTGEEITHHYLWRFWRALPKAGHIAVFDRSWYGRVLVERVEGFCSEDDWRRAYQEINDFEGQLAAFGTVLVKFWIHIDKDEQARRFKERMETPEKQWKIGDEDWRNRKKWDLYEPAVEEMLLRTSSPHAPWTIIEGNDKRHARLRALRTVIERIEGALT